MVGADELGKITVNPFEVNEFRLLKEEYEEAEGPRRKEIEQLLTKFGKDEKEDTEGKQEIPLSEFWKDRGALIMLVRRPG